MMVTARCPSSRALGPNFNRENGKSRKKEGDYMDCGEDTDFDELCFVCGDVGSISLEYIKEDQRLWFRRFQVVGRLDLSSGSLL